MSKSCQVAASLIPKFKLNWTANENRDEITQHFIEIVANHTDTSMIISSSQESNQSSISTTEQFEIVIQNMIFSVLEKMKLSVKIMIVNYLLIIICQI